VEKTFAAWNVYGARIVSDVPLSGGAAGGGFVQVNSPLSIRLTDPDGLSVSFDPARGLFDASIPGAYYEVQQPIVSPEDVYSGDTLDVDQTNLPGLLYLPEVKNGAYRFDVTGTAAGAWSVTFDAPTPRGGLQRALAEKGMIELGQQLSFTATIHNLLGDFNANGLLDSDDIDLLYRALRDQSNDAVFDVNADGSISGEDANIWVAQLANTYFGDADLNGEFNSGDLIQVLAAGQYEDAIEQNSRWAVGDFDGDAEFTTSDLIVALADGGYEQGPRIDAVPEPGSLGLIAGSLAWPAIRCRRRWHRRASSWWNIDGDVSR
jgi:hypothetical protein